MHQTHEVVVMSRNICCLLKQCLRIEFISPSWLLFIQIVHTHTHMQKPMLVIS